jgi:hypothetical protein
MVSPDRSKYEVTLGQVRQLTAADRASRDLHSYLTSFTGAKFDQLVDRRSPDEFTNEDFQAMRKLNVSVLRTARQSLLGDAKPEVRRLLGAIPSDLDIWDVAPGDFDGRLGPESAAWQLWQFLFDKQKGARRSGRGVTAGKLLHAKRPRLIPIFDRARISKASSTGQGQARRSASTTGTSGKPPGAHYGMLRLDLAAPQTLGPGPGPVRFPRRMDPTSAGRWPASHPA